MRLPKKVLRVFRDADPRWPLTRKSTFLLAWGLIYFLLGWLYTWGHLTEAVTGSLRWPRYAIPIEGWGVIWMGVGLFAGIAGVLRWWKVYAFAALTGMGILWSLSYFVGWLSGDATWGLSTAAIFAAFAFGAHQVAGMEDPKS